MAQWDFSLENTSHNPTPSRRPPREISVSRKKKTSSRPLVEPKYNTHLVHAGKSKNTINKGGKKITIRRVKRDWNAAHIRFINKYFIHSTHRLIWFVGDSLKIIGVGYDDEIGDVSTPFEHRLQSTKSMFLFEGPILILITYFLSLVFDFKFSFWVWFVVVFCILSLIYDWYKYFKNNVFIKLGTKIS